ncbi:MAG: Spy/CpxP family protein refolding chaperone [Myxococcota bacterium]|jgi:Spy/CpxP family protein refolding chaperone
MRKTTLITALALATTLIATSAFACPPGEGGERGERGPRVDKMVEKLGLDAEQEQQVRTLATDKKATVKPLRQKMRTLREQMGSLWEADELDTDAIVALHTEMGQLKSQIGQARLNFRLGMHGVLNAEQRAQMKAQRGKRGKRGKHNKRGRRNRGERGTSVEEPLDI